MVEPERIVAPFRPGSFPVGAYIAMAAGEVIFEIIGATSVCVPVTVVLVMAYWKKARAEIEAAGRGDQARRGPLGTHNKTSDITHREEAL